MIGSFPLLLAQTDTPPQPVLPDAPQTGSPAGDGTLAPASPRDVDTGVDDASGGGGGGEMLWIIILLGFVLLWVFMLGGQRKEKKKRQAMLSAMKKGDRVQTVGGVLGTVLDIKDDEITLKVDENSNTRMRFARNAIQTVIVDDKTE